MELSGKIPAPTKCPQSKTWRPPKRVSIYTLNERKYWRLSQSRCSRSINLLCISGQQDAILNQAIISGLILFCGIATDNNSVEVSPVNQPIIFLNHKSDDKKYGDALAKMIQ